MRRRGAQYHRMPGGQRGPAKAFHDVPLLAGVDSSTATATTPTCRATTRSISACHYQCNAPEINCVALVGFVRMAPRFAVRVGGGQSSTPACRAWACLWPDEAIGLLRAILDVWRPHHHPAGYRGSRRG
jgi:hypothetical protein